MTNTPDTHQFSGKNLDEAINEAAKYYSVDKAFVCYNIISNTQKSGFLSKIFSTKIQIEAWLETAKEDLQEAARKAVREALAPKPSSAPQPPRSNRTERSEFDTRTFVEYKDPKIKSLLVKYNQLFFSAFSLAPENYSTEISDNNIIIHVEDEFLEDLLTKSDKLSIAYEHVFKRIAQKNFGDITGRLSLDAGSSAEKREGRLIGIAKSLAEKVKKTGRSVVLASKSSQERRIIHLALDGFEGIGTRSVGMGDKRRLVIFSNSAPSPSTKPTHSAKKPHSHARKTGRNPSQKKKNSSSAPPTNEKLVIE